MRILGRAGTDIPSTKSSKEMSSNCSTSSMISFALSTLITKAALPAFRRVNLNFRRESLTGCGISTVWDYVGRHNHESRRGVRDIPSFVVLGMYVQVILFEDRSRRHGRDTNGRS